ncbi:MAG: hypothetical protein WD669_12205 [Pirellulales bacterium]
MPFSLIAGFLTVGFAIVWAFVGLMLLRLGRSAARQDADGSRR